ncbi:otefin [Drosophila tropicalis]|uniref:otefin n=1 Tax=Drosophila tropicalis TaxID=46794 RepID=UPI0035AB8662
MADMDDLDILSNAELRAKMVSQGLPNIPVTDSSRKVLVKRLRASLSGVAPGSPSSAAASPKKSSNRRDTLQPSSSSVAPVTAPKARRTLAVATPTKEAKETERPNRMAEEKPKQPASLVPIQTRRKSNTNTAPPTIDNRDVSKKPETIVEESQQETRNVQHEKTLEVNSLIVLESDDEEDEEMLRAAAKAEQEFQRSQKTKLSTTTTKTHEYISSSQTVEPPRPRQYEPVPVPVPSRVPVAAPAPVQSRAPALAPVTSQSVIGAGGSSTYDYLNTQGGRYSSYTSSSAHGYGSAKTNPSSVTTSYRHSPAAHLYPNQLSDDNEDEEESQYESTFAKNLARLRAEKLGDRSSPYSRRTVAGTSSSNVGYEPRARRSLRPEGTSVSVAFSNWINSLDQKYGLRSKIFILVVVLILIGVYNLFY